MEEVGGQVDVAPNNFAQKSAILIDIANLRQWLGAQNTFDFICAEMRLLRIPKRGFQKHFGWTPVGL